MDGGDTTSPDVRATASMLGAHARLSPAQRKWLERGLTQPGGKLPLFDDEGRKINSQVVKKCLASGWVEPWFANQLKPDWLVCKLTTAGRAVLRDA